MNRERSDTLGSGDRGGLRERSFTAGSVRSQVSESGGIADLTSLEFIRLVTPPRVRTNNPRSISSGAPKTPNNGSSNSVAHKKPPATRAHAVVDWLQSRRVPAPLYRAAGRGWQTLVQIGGNHTSRNNNTPQSVVVLPDVHEDAVYWIAGLDRVLFGTAAAAETVTVAGVKPPRYLFYMMSGMGCDVIQLCMDVFLHRYIEDASICWATTFFLSVVWRHSSHRYLVFGDYVGGYWASLGRMYGGYSIIIVLSTIFNVVMTRGAAHLSHYVAWILTLLWTGIANYFILKKLWSYGGSAGSSSSSKTGSG
jgi:hypothetical protein